MPQHFRQWVNVKHVFKRVFKHNPKGMVGMLERLGLTLEGRHHSGIDDCRNISKVVRALAQRGVVLECTATTEGVGQAGAGTSRAERSQPRSSASGRGAGQIKPVRGGGRARTDRRKGRLQ